MARDAVLQLEGNGDVEIDLLSAFLADLSDAYSSLYAFDKIMGRLERSPFEPWIEFLSIYPARRGRGRRAWYTSAPAPEDTSLQVPISERLRLRQVKLASPGFWQFLGALNPLEVMRHYLCDRHQRRQDREYRESAERRRLELENLLLENRVLKERLDMARDMELAESDLAPLVRQLIERPLTKLGEYQDRGLIEGASIVDSAEGRRSCRCK